MPADASRSAVVVRVSVPARLDQLRGRWDPAAAVGVPGHVTILYPFVSPADLDGRVRTALAEVAATNAPFDVRFDRVGRFPTVVYLVPDPPEPFIRLTEAVQERFPDLLPYEGAFDEVIPHLTIADSDEAPLDVVATEATAALPVVFRVSRLDVLVQGADGRWRSRWRLPFGNRSDRD
ncbi:MAG: 2'-5' RNA ligase family protein [Chloroflexota bacterium]